MNTHESITDRLSDYIDGELDARERAELDAHLAECTDCREVQDQLRSIAAAAGQLPVTLPERDLWDGVAARIGAQAGGTVTSFPRRPSRRFSFTVPQLAAAGIALMLLSGVLSYSMRWTDSSQPADGAAVAPVNGAGFLPVALADPHYDGAISDLEAALVAGRSRLDPETVRVLEQNLAVIDQAIEQCRRALEADPANAFLNSHLVSARQRKLALLRRATALTAGS